MGNPNTQSNNKQPVKQGAVKRTSPNTQTVKKGAVLPKESTAGSPNNQKNGKPCGKLTTVGQAVNTQSNNKQPQTMKGVGIKSNADKNARPTPKPIKKNNPNVDKVRGVKK